MRKPDRRLLGAAFTVAAVLLGGAWFAWLEPAHAPQAVSDVRPGSSARREAPARAGATRDAELSQHFNSAVLLLHAKEYERAAAVLTRVLELAPQMPEAHVNLGFALLGLNRPTAARNAFEAAMALKAVQANAYYGLALTYEALGDLELALGAMRSYLHLARDQNESHLRRARSALWEWETRLAERRGAAPAR
jgi:tetratricopeptide (TPR) repeat protein